MRNKIAKLNTKLVDFLKGSKTVPTVEGDFSIELLNHYHLISFVQVDFQILRATKLCIFLLWHSPSIRVAYYKILFLQCVKSYHFSLLQGWDKFVLNISTFNNLPYSIRIYLKISFIFVYWGRVLWPHTGEWWTEKNKQELD